MDSSLEELAPDMSSSSLSSWKLILDMLSSYFLCLKKSVTADRVCGKKAKDVVKKVRCIHGIYVVKKQ